MKKILLISTLAGMFLCGVNAMVANNQPQNKFKNFIGKVKQSAIGQAIGKTLQNTQTGQAISQLVGNRLGMLTQSAMPTVNQTVMNMNTALTQVEMEINQAYTMQINAGQNNAAAKQQCDAQIAKIRQNLNGLQASLAQNVAQVPTYMTNVVSGCNQLQMIVRTSFPTVNTQSLTTYANNLQVAQALNQNIEGAISQCQTLRANYDARMTQNINSMSNPADQSAALAAKQAVDNDFNSLIQNFQMMRQNIMMSQMLDVNSFNQTRNNIQTSISDLQMRLGNDVNFSGSVTQLSSLSQVVLNSTATGLDQVMANKINNYSTNTMPVNTTPQQTYNQYNQSYVPTAVVPVSTVPATIPVTAPVNTSSRRRG